MTDDDVHALIELLYLKGIGPARSRWLTASAPPSEVVAMLRRGRLPRGIAEPPSGVRQAHIDRWTAELRSTDRGDLLERHRSAGVRILWPGHTQWPFELDPDPPALVFAIGDLALLAPRTRVGVVGTRRCTSVGRRVARQISADLCERSGQAVAIVSGLAAGIDAEAHIGSLDVGGKAVGVVACGLDVPYPKSNTSLWERVTADGLLLSESPLGASPERWKFPARNRLIAALSNLVVVVESHRAGGALSTAEEAAARGVTVGAVPGSVLSSASDGTNALIVDGCPPIRDVGDALDLLGLESKALDQTALDQTVPVQLRLPAGSDASWVSRELTSLERRLVEETFGGPVHLDHLFRALADDPRPIGRAQILVAAQHLVDARVLAMDGSKLTLVAPGARSRGEAVRGGTSAHRYRSAT